MAAVNLETCWIFAFDSPRGGWRDFITSKEDLQEARSTAKGLAYRNWQVLNTQTGELIEGTNPVKDKKT